MPNYYEILGVKPDATPEEIKKAFHSRATECHPDSNQNSKESVEEMQAINNAYSTLKDPQKRKEYDEKYLKTKSQTSNSSQPHKKTYYAGPESESSFYSYDSYDSSYASEFQKFQEFKNKQQAQWEQKKSNTQESKNKQQAYREQKSSHTQGNSSRASHYQTTIDDVVNFFQPEVLWPYLTGECAIPLDDKYKRYYQAARDFGKLCANFSLAHVSPVPSGAGMPIDNEFLGIYIGITKSIFVCLEKKEGITVKNLGVLSKYEKPSFIDSAPYEKVRQMVFDGKVLDGKVRNLQILDIDIRVKIIRDYVKALYTLGKKCDLQKVKSVILNVGEPEKNYFHGR